MKRKQLNVFRDSKRSDKEKTKRMESHSNTQDFLELSLIIPIRQRRSYVRFSESRGESKT